MLQRNLTRGTRNGADRSRWLRVVVTAAALVAATVPGVATSAATSGAALAAETVVSCEQPVAGAVKLANDLLCVETDGLVVVADDTVIDLNGHRIECVGAGYLGSCQGIVHGATNPDPEPEDGVLINGHRNVHVFTSVPGATISGFDNGIHMERVTEVKIEHLIITGPASPGVVNPRPFSHGILIRGSSCPDEDGNIHIGTGQSSGNDLSNANQGIAINGSCVHVVHNRVHDNNSNSSVPSNGILINNGSNNVVRGNEVFKNGDPFPIDNTDQDGGITMRNNSRFNHIANNVVNGNFGDGISVRIASSNNKMDNNTMLFNGGEASGTVFYDAAGRGAPGGPPGSSPLNEWNQNNMCLTQNAEVPPGTCGPQEGSTSPA